MRHIDPIEAQARHRRRLIDGLDAVFAQQRKRIGDKLNRIEAWGTERKTVLGRAIERETGGPEPVIVDSREDALDHVDDDDAPNDEVADKQFDAFIHRK